MVFTQIAFALFLLLSLFLVSLTKTNREWTIWTVIFLSCVFYAWNEPVFLCLILAAASVDFVIARAISRQENATKRKLLLLISVSWNLGILSYFKYSHFLVENFNQIITRFGWRAPMIVPAVFLPLGISFFTFEALSYSIDVYNSKYKPSQKLNRKLFFITIYQHLDAGPIVRAKHHLPQLEDRKAFVRDYSGVFIILWGFTKKILLADPLGSLLVVPVFSDPSSYSRLSLLVAVYSYAFQIFLDFSGYTDIAIGVARLFGLDLGQNFNAPYLSQSCSEFWRRWHISLSSWFRDYVFIPLGGSRVSRLKLYRNIMVTFVLSGLWHGANWRFLIWGGLNGIYVICEDALQAMAPLKSFLSPLKDWVFLRVAITFHLICFAWIFFRAKDFSASLDFITRLFSQKVGSPPELAYLGFLGVAAISHLVVEPRRETVSQYYLSLPVGVQCAAWLLLALGGYHFSSQFITHQAFIYFKF